MRLTLAAVGRLGRSPESLLAAGYCSRATASGRALGLGPVEIVEAEARRPGRPGEADALRAAVGEGALLVACDERGRAWSSREFATRIAGWRDAGERRLAFLLGGADGLDPALREQARETLAFGPQTWPHALARVMLAEQVYRAVTILSGSPYHRE